MSKFYRHDNEIVSLNCVSNIRLDEHSNTTTCGGYKHVEYSYTIYIYYRVTTPYNTLRTHDKAEALRMMDEIFTILTTK